MTRSSLRSFRTLLAAVGSAMLAACGSLPGLQDPQVTISPRYYLYTQKGEARMQSVVGGTVVENPPMGMTQFGQSGRDDDVGAVLAVGDGFSGIEIEYQHIDISDSSQGILTADYGKLSTGTFVDAELNLDEYRLTYVGDLVDHEFEVGSDQSLRMRFGAGAALVHREGSFAVAEFENLANNQNIKFKDHGLPYLSFRGRVDWRMVSLNIDWDYNPDIQFFGGDFSGMQHDIEILGRYRLEDQDITFVAGYRWSDLQTSGTQDDLRYDTDFWVEGYVLGLEFAF